VPQQISNSEDESSLGEGSTDSSTPQNELGDGLDHEKTGPARNIPNSDKRDYYSSATSATTKLHYLDEDQANASEGYYNSETGDYAVYNPKTNQTEAGKYKSGTDGRSQGHRPIAKGDYAVVEMSKQGYFRLESLDEKFGDDKVEKTGQDLIRQHGPGRSKGCLTSVDQESWNRTEPVIRSSRAGEVTVDRSVRAMLGDIVHGREIRRTEQVGYFGTLRVF
jgi:hypothetical protein